MTARRDQVRAGGRIASVLGIAAALLLSGITVHAQELDLPTLRYDLQVGLDSWDLRPSVDKDTAENQSGNRTLFLANSTPYWPYENPSSWVKFQGVLQIGERTSVMLRYRRDVSSGSKLDALSLDHGFYGAGVRFGVLDYKTSWCRTYDVDSPWVRENDPFCTVKTTSIATSGAPGVQVYTDSIAGPFKLQTVAGYYNPLWFDYQPKEFTNLTLGDESQVKKNDKWGVSVNATHLENALEMRLSYLHSDQYADVVPIPKEPAYRITQQVDVIYAGLSFNPTPLINVRLTQLQSNMSSFDSYPTGYHKPDDLSPDLLRRDQAPKASQVLEVNYQSSARDILSVAHSVYSLQSEFTAYTVDAPSLNTLSQSYPDAFVSHTVNTSLSWRRDWQKGMFTVLQWSAARVDSARNSQNLSGPVTASSNGTAIGLRLGYRF